MSKTNLKKYRDKYKQVTLYLSHEEAATLEELIQEEESMIKDLRNKLRSRLGVLNILREDLKNETKRTEEGSPYYE